METIERSAKIKSSLELSSLEKELELELQTREQSSNEMWFQAMSKRITNSNCGRILNKTKKSISLCESVYILSH